MPTGLNDQLRDVLLPYTRLGVADWKARSPDIREKARRCLADIGIAESQNEAMHIIGSILRHNRFSDVKLIPMPKSSSRGPECFFFLPTHSRSSSMTFELCVLCEQENILAFRFEKAHNDSRHDYGHVQFSRKIKEKTIGVRTPDWIPVSYPAFPVPVDDPLSGFLSLVVSAHGYSGGFLRILMDIFQGASAAAKARFYHRELVKMLRQ